VFCKYGYVDGGYFQEIGGQYSPADKLIIDIRDETGNNFPLYLWFDPGEINGKLKISLTPVLDETDADPYAWYKIPVTINGTTVNIYDRTPLSKTGSTSDYIDYAEQKRDNTDGTTEDVTLPALPTIVGTNTLSVVTTVQPSEISVTGRITKM
jgi:hypothetical protein